MAETKNVRALKSFRLKGEVIVEGEVVAKSQFPDKGTWQNLVNMKPARAEETDDAVGKPEGTKEVDKKATRPAMPSATK